MSVHMEAQDLASRLEREEITRKAFADDLSRVMTEAVGCRRASVWLFEAPCRPLMLVCLGSHDTQLHGPLTGLGGGDDAARDGSHGPFLYALHAHGEICAADAERHPATGRLFHDVLSPRGVESLLAVPFSINGSLRGAFVCVSVGRRVEWKAHQLGCLKRIVARVGPALAGALVQDRGLASPFPDR